MTDERIAKLIKLPKTIQKRNPTTGYKIVGKHRRCNLELVTANSEYFLIFIRQSLEFIENFSIGLVYTTSPSPITLLRYNGPHGETSKSADEHYARPHIHRITAAEIQKGSKQPQANHRKVTDKYSTFEEAQQIFFNNVYITNWKDYFNDITQIKFSYGN